MRLHSLAAAFLHAASIQKVLGDDQHPSNSSSSSSSSWKLSEQFSLSSTNGVLEIQQYDSVKGCTTTIWSTVTGKPFLSASKGTDVVTGTSGAFQITHTDTDLCQSQNVTDITSIPWGNATAAKVEGYLLGCGEDEAEYEVVFWVPGGDLNDRINFHVNVKQEQGAANPLTKIYLNFASNSHEDFYGLGGQASFASLKGQSIPVFSREQGVGRGDEPITSLENANGSIAGGSKYTTYTAIPSYITTDGRVFYLAEESIGYANFNFTVPNEISIRYDAIALNGSFARMDNMLDAIETLTAYTGRMPALPTWVDNGAILGIQGGQDKVNGIVEQGLSHNISCPIAGVWLQDWCGTHPQQGPYLNISRLWWNWENDNVLYPTWNDFVQNLRQNHNVRTLSYINVFLANVSTKSTGYRRSLYNEASLAHYFVQNTTTNDTAIISSGPGIEAGIIDLTNPDLRTWFEEVLRTQVWNANISGFMSDFGEYTPVTADTKIYNTVGDAFYYHNSYPSQWAEFQRGVVKDLNLQSEALLFHRSAAMSSNRNMNLFWVGDQNVNWDINDGMKSVVTLMVHMGLSGYSQLHSDVGGYTTVLTYSKYNITRSPELLGRWGELAAVSSAAFRSHEGNIPSVNAQFYSNSSTYGYYAYNARMFVSLAKYRRHILETESEPKGWPLLRPPVLYHTEDPIARNISYQSFYLGEHLYVAPVLDPQTFSVEVYFPGCANRTYEHVWSGKTYVGGKTATVSAPFGKPPVFLVDGVRTPELKPFLEFVQKENGTALSIY